MGWLEDLQKNNRVKLIVHLKPITAGIAQKKLLQITFIDKILAKIADARLMLVKTVSIMTRPSIIFAANPALIV